MHRSRPPVFAIFAAVAACSTRHDPDANEILSQDSTLVATLEVRQKAAALPDACGPVTVTAQPGAVGRAQAAELARQAYDAELLGDTPKARSLLLRALRLDATDKSAAYHLGRTSEAIGDRTVAVAAYCRYLTLAPTTAESAEARQRVAVLSQNDVRVAAAPVGRSVAAGRPVVLASTSASPRRETRVRRVAERAAATMPSTRVRSASDGVHSGSTGTGASDPRAATGDGVEVSPNVDVGSQRATDQADGVAVSNPARVDQPSSESRSASRAPSAMQSVGIGAVAGAIIGAATGRSVKSAVIGAAAGGALGTVVGGMNNRPSNRAMSRGVRPAA